MDQYKQEVIDWDDRASEFAREICRQSHGNSDAIHIIPPESDNFRGPERFFWRRHILDAMMQYDFFAGRLQHWTMAEVVQDDGAGHKPQFFTLLGDEVLFRRLGWEIVVANADDFARSGCFPVIMANDMQVKRLTDKNWPLYQAAMEGYVEALEAARLVNIAGEFAVMKHAITAFCDTGQDDQLVLTWSAACIGLAHRQLLIDDSEIEPAMSIIGFWEPGYRANGGTFCADLILEKWGGNIRELMANPDVREFARALTVPSQCYAPTVTRLIGWLPNGLVGEPKARIYGIAHITGGGVWGKFGKILPIGVGARLKYMPKPADVLLQAQELSWDTPLRLTDYRAYSTFHGGCGMLLVCHTDDVDIIIAAADNDGIRASDIGVTMESADSEVIIRSRFREGKLLSSNNPE